jgi:hypothetical protein
MKNLVNILFLALLGVALAHADGVSSTPKAGERLKEAPGEVQIVFDEAVELSVSVFKVYRLEATPEQLANERRLRILADELVGQVLSLKDDAVQRSDSGHKSKARTSKEITLGLKALTPGAYVVMWRVLSVDSHISSAHFVFVVEP